MQWSHGQKVGFGVLCVFAVATFFALGGFWDFSKSEWASWVQAVGSLVGLGVAVWQPFKMRFDERKEARRREEAAAHIVAANEQLMMNPLLGCIGGALETISTKKKWMVEDVNLMQRRAGIPDLPGEDQLRELVLVERSAAIGLARGVRHFRQYQMVLNFLFAKNGEWHDIQMKHTMNDLNELFNNAQNLLRDAFARIQAFEDSLFIEDVK